MVMLGRAQQCGAFEWRDAFRMATTQRDTPMNRWSVALGAVFANESGRRFAAGDTHLAKWLIKQCVETLVFRGYYVTRGRQMACGSAAIHQSKSLAPPQTTQHRWHTQAKFFDGEIIHSSPAG